MAMDREAIGEWVAKLQRISDRFSEVEKRVSDPEVASNQEAFATLMIEHRRLQPMAVKANELVTAPKIGMRPLNGPNQKTRT